MDAHTNSWHQLQCIMITDTWQPRLYMYTKNHPSTLSSALHRIQTNYTNKYSQEHHMLIMYTTWTLWPSSNGNRAWYMVHDQRSSTSVHVSLHYNCNGAGNSRRCALKCLTNSTPSSCFFQNLTWPSWLAVTKKSVLGWGRRTVCWSLTTSGDIEPP